MRHNLIILRTPDIERLRDFYARLLQVTFTRHTDHGPEHYAAPLKGLTIEIYPTKRRLEQLDGQGFSVLNLETILARVDKTALHQAPFETPVGRSAMIKDPDGRLIYLTEEKQGEQP